VDLIAGVDNLHKLLNTQGCKKNLNDGKEESAKTGGKNQIYTLHMKKETIRAPRIGKGRVRFLPPTPDRWTKTREVRKGKDKKKDALY